MWTWLCHFPVLGLCFVIYQMRGWDKVTLTVPRGPRNDPLTRNNPKACRIAEDGFIGNIA